MTPVEFPQANTRFGPPDGLDHSQCLTIYAYAGEIAHRSALDGAPIVVTAWKPSPEEIDRILSGEPVFLTFIGGCPPHFVCTDFDTAAHPA